jgi:hypothetical protein
MNARSQDLLGTRKAAVAVAGLDVDAGRESGEGAVLPDFACILLSTCRKILPDAGQVRKLRLSWAFANCGGFR